VIVSDSPDVQVFGITAGLSPTIRGAISRKDTLLTFDEALAPAKESK
jgi:hypothetical protein